MKKTQTKEGSSFPPNYAIYAYYPPRDQLVPGQIRAVVVLTAVQAFQAKRTVMSFMEESDDFEWIGENRIMGRNGIELYCPQGLEEVIKYKFKEGEREYRMSPEYEDQVNRLRRPRGEDDSSPSERPEGETPKKKVKVEKQAEKPKRAGLVDMNQIAQDLKVDAKDARQALRKAKIDKPSVGWAFPEDQVAGIKEAILKHIKKR